MKITIGYLYYDLMNLYGDIGNVKALEYHLKEQNIKTEIKKLSIDDEIDFNELDLIYIGASTEQNRLIALKHLKKYQQEIKDAIENNKFFLITGNALSLFGKSIDDEKALDIFDFKTTTTKRNVKEIITKSKIIKDDIYTFVNNKDDIIYNTHNFLFKDEGIYYNNFYGTSFIGPLLIRNPKFLKEFIKKLILSKNNKHKFKKINITLNNKAYTEFIEFKKTKIKIK